MSIKIEILDYKYGIDNMTDVNAGSASTGWTATSSTSAYWDGSGSGISYLNNISTPSLVIGTAYNLSFEITNYSGTGDMGFSFTGGVPLTARFSSNTNGVKYFTFIATGAVSLDLFGRSTNSGNISSISIKDANVIDWENSVVGELDITDHTDFPLAMTFQISDFKDITSTSGDYSKTFKIPATKNNNQIFKNLYIANIDVDNNVTARKKCRILVDNLYSTLGLIKVNGVSGYGENASHYDCVFFGNNLTWASGIDDAYMSDIDWGTEGEGLTYNKSSIMDTWQHEDSNNASKSPIVYPVTSYGVYNVDGVERTIQLLDTLGENNVNLDPLVYKGYTGFYDDGNSYETPQPVADWRPTIFVKKTLDNIFAGLSGGFKISSSFMNTEMFKKLVWSLPNFKYNNPTDRFDLYATETSFTNNVDLSIPASSGLAAISQQGVFQIFNTSIDEQDGDEYYSGTGAGVVDIDDIVSDPSAYNISVVSDNSTNLKFTNNYVLVPEYGYYNIVLTGLEVKVARTFKGGSNLKVINSIFSRIAVEVQTVGHTSWVPIESSVNEFVINQNVNENIDRNTVYQDVNDINIQRQFLNKGDKIRIRKGLKITATTTTQNFAVYLFVKSKATSIFNLEFAPEYVEYGQTYDLSEVINKDMRQIDFIKGVAHAFNLQMTTDSESRIIYIEPFNDFYKPLKEGIDWTYKLDRSKEISDKWLKTDLKRIMTFKYKSDDADAKVKHRGKEFFDNIQDEYPYRETLPDTFEKGDSIFENPFFAGSYNAKDKDTTQFENIDNGYSACLWTENVSSNDEGRPDKGYDFLPRLLSWNKYSPTGLPTPAGNFGIRRFAAVQTWSNVIKYLNPNADTSLYGNLISTIYPQATMINRDSSTSPVLSYGNIIVNNYDDATGVYGSAEIGSGLFETYYRNSIEMLKDSPRIRNVYVSLKISDIINLDFTKLIYIDGVYWRISKVSDYMPNKNESTKVELIEWFASRVYSFNVPIFRGRPSTWGVGSGSPFAREPRFEP